MEIADPHQCTIALRIAIIRAVNRSFFLFVGFLGVFVLGLVAVAAWVGPVRNIALSSDLREAPYYVIALERTDRLEALDRLVRSTDSAGEVLYSGRLDHMQAGLVRRDEWRRLSVYGFTSGADFLKLVTSESYRQTRPEDGERVLLGTPRAPDVKSDQAWSLWLVQRRDGQLLEAHSALLTTSQEFGGRAAWDADVVAIEGPAPWEALRVVSFPSVKQAFAWHENPYTQTEVTLMKARYAASAGLLFAGG